MDEKNLNALISLLDDDDREVYAHVRERLLDLGIQVIPRLEQVWAGAENPGMHRKLEDIIREIQFSALQKEFTEWAHSLDADLLTGAWLVSRLIFPGIDLDDIRRKMLRLRQHIWLELSVNQSPLEQIHTFNQIFYYHEGFRGNQSEEPFDFCLSHVLEKRTGNSLSLGILYQCLASDLNLPVYGVNLPRHFVLCFCRRTLLDFPQTDDSAKDILFYINPINKGSVFSRNEIKEYLQRLNLHSNPRYFLPSPPKKIIQELIHQMREAFRDKKDAQRVHELSLLLQILDNESQTQAEE